MWRPRTESEIQAGIDNGVTRETSSFDAKRQLPPTGRNKDLAKDICAMTVNGGVLLYGLDGDDPTRPDRREPFDLAGSAERIDQVAQTGIAEPPVIEIYDIPSIDHPGLGYLCVVIPASPRAPHMLTIDGDNRYWGRGETGNRIMTEGEVARLYERREQWTVDRELLLVRTIERMPFTFDLPATGVGVTVVKPVFPGRELLRIAAGGDPVDDFLRRALPNAADAGDLYPDQGASNLAAATRVSQPQADLWVCSETDDPGFAYQARLELEANGSLTYWNSPAIHSDNDGPRLLMERSLTRAVHQALAVTSWLHDRAGFHGAVDIGVAVIGIEGVTGSTQRGAFIGRAPIYRAAEYRRHDRVTSQEMSSSLSEIVLRLLAPLYEVVSLDGYDPLNDN